MNRFLLSTLNYRKYPLVTTTSRPTNRASTFRKPTPQNKALNFGEHMLPNKFDTHTGNFVSTSGDRAWRIPSNHVVEKRDFHIRVIAVT